MTASKMLTTLILAIGFLFSASVESQAQKFQKTKLANKAVLVNLYKNKPAITGKVVFPKSTNLYNRTPEQIGNFIRTKMQVRYYDTSKQGNWGQIIPSMAFVTPKHTAYHYVFEYKVYGNITSFGNLPMNKGLFVRIPDIALKSHLHMFFYTNPNPKKVVLSRGKQVINYYNFATKISPVAY